MGAFNIHLIEADIATVWRWQIATSAPMSALYVITVSSGMASKELFKKVSLAGERLRGTFALVIPAIITVCSRTKCGKGFTGLAALEWLRSRRTSQKHA
jgi:hypothetical protein